MFLHDLVSKHMITQDKMNRAISHNNNHLRSCKITVVLHDLVLILPGYHFSDLARCAVILAGYHSSDLARISLK